MTDWRDKRELVRDLAEENSANASGWIRVHCPFCEELGHRSSTKNLAINPDSGWYQCWRHNECRTTGFLYDQGDQPYSDTYNSVRALTTVKVRTVEDMKGASDVTDVKGFKAIVPGEKGPGFIYSAYMRSRGVSDKVIVQMKAGYTTSDPKYNGRVILPMLSYDGKAGYYGSVTRTIVGKDYRNTPGLLRDAMFNEAALWVDTSEPVGIVEAVFGAAKHFPYATAVNGKPTNIQLGILARCQRPLVIMLDGDARSDAYALRQHLELRGKTDVSVSVLPPQTDPGDITAVEFIDRLLGEGQ